MPKDFADLYGGLLNPLQVRKLGDIKYSEFLNCPGIGQVRFNNAPGAECLTVTLGRKLTIDYIEFMNEIELTDNHLYVNLGEFYELVIPNDAVNLVENMEENEWEYIRRVELHDDAIVNDYVAYYLPALKIESDGEVSFCNLNVAEDHDRTRRNCLVLADTGETLHFKEISDDYSGCHKLYLSLYDLSVTVGGVEYLVERRELEAILEKLEMEPYLERNLRGIIHEPKQVQAHRKNHGFKRI